MDARDDLRRKLDELERRFDELRGEIVALAEVSLSLEMTVAQLMAREMIPAQQLERRIGFALDLYRNRGGPAAARELSRIQDSILDAQVSSFDEEDLPRA